MTRTSHNSKRRTTHGDTGRLGAALLKGGELVPESENFSLELNTRAEGGREDAAGSGQVHVKVEPSTKVENALYVEVNEEFRAPKDSNDSTETSVWVTIYVGAIVRLPVRGLG